LHVGEATHHAAIGHAVASDAQHRAIDVAQHDLARIADAIAQQRGDVARPAGEIEHAIARLHLGGSDEIPLPDAMDAHRHQVVHQVVLARHG
jgi:hypothetical protein